MWIIIYVFSGVFQSMMQSTRSLRNLYGVKIDHCTKYLCIMKVFSVTLTLVLMISKKSILSGKSLLNYLYYDL